MAAGWGEARVEVTALYEEIRHLRPHCGSVKRVYEHLRNEGKLTVSLRGFYKNVHALDAAYEAGRLQSSAAKSAQKPSPHHDIFERPLKRGASSTSSKDANAPSDAQSDDTAVAATSASSASDRSTRTSSSQSPSTSASERSGPRIATAAPSTLNWDASPEAVERAVQKFWGDDENDDEAAQDEQVAKSKQKEAAS